MLKGKKPEEKEKRLKMFVYGSAGVGKTTAALKFPKSYIIDTEHGTDFYAKTINAANSVVLHSLNPDEIKEELKALLTEKHPYKTLIIDPVTQVYNATQEKWSRIFEKHAKSTKDAEIQDFGMRYWGKVKSDFKAVQRLMLALDMNVIITAHQKDVYGNGMQKLGVGPDSMKGDEYLFDIVFRIDRVGGKLMAYKIKERSEPMDSPKFPNEFEWSYENFVKFYGKEIIEKEAKPMAMAAKTDIDRLNKLIEIVKIEDSDIQKWLTKANVDSFEEFTKEQINASIEFVTKKLKQLNGGSK